MVEEKVTHPKMLRFPDVMVLTEKYDRKELNVAFKQLVSEGKIKVREGINTKLIEII